MLEGSIHVTLIFKIHYKAMFSAFVSKHKFQSQKGKTLLLQTDLSRTNIVVPKSIQQKDVTLPKYKILECTTQPKPLQPPQPNIQLKQITQYSDGKIKLSFHRNSTSSRFSDESSTSSTINLGRISEIPPITNILYNINSSRKSTSNIPSTNFQKVDYTCCYPIFDPCSDKFSEKSKNSEKH